jgi:hypothetical protein
LAAFDFLAVIFGLPVLGRRHQQIEKPLSHALFRFGFDLLTLLLLDESDRGFSQVANHALDIAANVADLGVLGGFDLDERRADKRRKLPCNLGFAHAGRPDHDDVLWRDGLAQFGRKLLPAPAIAYRDGNGFLRCVLANDIAIQLGNDLPRRKVHSVSPVGLHSRYSYWTRASRSIVSRRTEKVVGLRMNARFDRDSVQRKGFGGALSTRERYFRLTFEAWGHYK